MASRYLTGSISRIRCGLRRASWEKRWEEYAPAREEQFRVKEEKARRESKLNTEFAKKLRDEYK